MQSIAKPPHQTPAIHRTDVSVVGSGPGVNNLRLAGRLIGGNCIAGADPDTVDYGAVQAGLIRQGARMH